VSEIVGQHRCVAVTDESWTREVLLSERPVLVDFWAVWCPPCRKLTPLLEQLAVELADSVKIVTLNIDENPHTSRDYGVLSAPTLMVFSGGEVVRSMVGLRPKAQIVQMIEAAL
jgi:thioredoxin 1